MSISLKINGDQSKLLFQEGDEIIIKNDNNIIQQLFYPLSKTTINIKSSISCDNLGIMFYIPNLPKELFSLKTIHKLGENIEIIIYNSSSHVVDISKFTNIGTLVYNSIVPITTAR